MLAQFLADSVAGSQIELVGEEARHAASVVRIRVGERIRISDGVNECIEGVVTAVDKHCVKVSVESRVLLPPNQLQVVVAQALTKGESASIAVELLTEVGVDEILPWNALRSIAKWDAEKRDKGVTRWLSVAREACKQSRRIDVPKIDRIHSTRELVARIETADCAIILHESGEKPFSTIAIPSEGVVVLVIGPEGGIDDSELDLFRSAGAHVAVLGPTVLRSAHAGYLGAGLIVSRRWTQM